MKYYAVVRPESAEDERPQNALTLSVINRSLERHRAIMAISLAVLEVKDWFNVKGNLNDRQVTMTAEMILDNPNFYDLSLGNIKACFRKNMQTAKVYDRIDGNILIGWLSEFKSEMADTCYNSHLEADKIAEKENEGISHEMYLAILKARSESGEKEATEILSDYERRKKIKSIEETRENEIGFFKFKTEYDHSNEKAMGGSDNTAER